MNVLVASLVLGGIAWVRMMAAVLVDAVSPQPMLEDDMIIRGVRYVKTHPEMIALHTLAGALVFAL